MSQLAEIGSTQYHLWSHALELDEFLDDVRSCERTTPDKTTKTNTIRATTKAVGIDGGQYVRRRRSASRTIPSRTMSFAVRMIKG